MRMRALLFFVVVPLLAFIPQPFDRRVLGRCVVGEEFLELSVGNVGDKSTKDDGIRLADNWFSAAIELDAGVVDEGTIPFFWFDAAQETGVGQEAVPKYCLKPREWTYEDCALHGS